MIRAGLIQICASDDPQDNLPKTIELIERAADDGAWIVLTPEVTNCVSTSRTHQQAVLSHEKDDLTLDAMCNLARKRSIWLLLGSIAVKTTDPNGRFANRSILISPTGSIVARYDKIHMFDVQISATESYRESSGYRAGEAAKVVQTGRAKIGMTICYDVRFPELFRRLATAGAQIITVPSAFSPVTGKAHWESLLRARAIETGAYILAPAQTGMHPTSGPKPRTTYGHSLVIDPWGKVIADAGTQVGVTMVDLDLNNVDHARSRIPAINNAAQFTGP